MRILLDLDVNLPTATTDWLNNNDRISSLLPVLENVGLWQRFSYYTCKDQIMKHYETKAAFIEMHSWQEGGLYTLIDHPQNNTISLTIHLSYMAFSLQISLQETYIQSTVQDPVAQLTDVIKGIHKILGNDINFGPNASVRPIDLSFPRLHPPRYHRHFPQGAIVTAVDSRYYALNDFHQEDANTLLATPVPDWATRIDLDELTIFQWTNQVKDRQQLIQDCMRQEEWLADTLHLPIDPSYNDAGDYLVSSFGLQQDDILTFYNPMQNFGYKSVVMFPDGSVDDELFQEMAQWCKEKKLPNGKSLKQLNIILPSRQSAVAIREKALSFGIKGVYYLDNDGKMWNPFPPGNWR